MQRFLGFQFRFICIEFWIKYNERKIDRFIRCGVTQAIFLVFYLIFWYVHCNSYVVIVYRNLYWGMFVTSKMNDKKKFNRSIDIWLQRYLSLFNIFHWKFHEIDIGAIRTQTNLTFSINYNDRSYLTKKRKCKKVWEVFIS